MEEEVLPVVEMEGMRDSVDGVLPSEGARRARSSMKLPAATLEGVWGRWRKSVMS